MMKLHPAVTSRNATFSECGLYRYDLTSSLRGGDGTRCVFFMLNPSTASHEHDDPTVRRCMEFGRRWGHSFVDVVNLFALRSPHPKDLRAAADPIGPLNDETIRRRCLLSCRIVFAWGRGGDFLGRADQVIRMLRQHEGIRQQCLGTTKDGHPKHPLARGKHRIPDDFEPVAYRSEVRR